MMLSSSCHVNVLKPERLRDKTGALDPVCRRIWYHCPWEDSISFGTIAIFVFVFSYWVHGRGQHLFGILSTPPTWSARGCWLLYQGNAQQKRQTTIASLLVPHPCIQDESIPVQPRVWAIHRHGTSVTSLLAWFFSQVFTPHHAESLRNNVERTGTYFTWLIQVSLTVATLSLPFVHDIQTIQSRPSSVAWNWPSFWPWRLALHMRLQVLVSRWPSLESSLRRLQ